VYQSFGHVRRRRLGDNRTNHERPSRRSGQNQERKYRKRRGGERERIVVVWGNIGVVLGGDCRRARREVAPGALQWSGAQDSFASSWRLSGASSASRFRRRRRGTLSHLSQAAGPAGGRRQVEEKKREDPAEEELVQHVKKKCTRTSLYSVRFGDIVIT
jgi:hypothetical protein